jgi:DNA-binding NtrC family response regulator
MACILSVGYEESLLHTRRVILAHAGHDVTSALGFTDTIKHCDSGRKFDLFIVGHSIPRPDKEAFISAFRAHSSAPIIILRGPGEEVVRGADFEITPEPNILVQLVQDLTSGKAKAAG